MRQKCLSIAYAVHESGRREVIGLDVGEAETEAFCREFLRGLRARGLAGVRLCVSDCHEGLKAAIGGMPTSRRDASTRPAAGGRGSVKVLDLRGFPLTEVRYRRSLS